MLLRQRGRLRTAEQRLRWLGHGRRLGEEGRHHQAAISYEAAAGADLVGTTLAGYTSARAKGAGPDLELVAALARELAGTPVVAEGRIHTPEQAAAALAAGAHAVVVGTAITHPTSITRWFADAMKGA